MWYLYTMDYHSIIKKNEILLFAGKGVVLENIIVIHTHTCTHMYTQIRTHVYIHNTHMYMCVQNMFLTVNR
jgi:hypothetical protein